MNTGLLHHARRRLVMLVAAAILALSAAYTPLLLDTLAGTALTPQAYACMPASPGCG
jgi:hypothetical protein